MFLLTKLVRTVGGGFKRKKTVQTVTWLSDVPKKFAVRLVNESVSVKCSKCQSLSHGLSRYSIVPVFVIGSKLTGISG